MNNFSTITIPAERVKQLLEVAIISVRTEQEYIDPDNPLNGLIKYKLQYDLDVLSNLQKAVTLAKAGSDVSMSTEDCVVLFRHTEEFLKEEVF
jgi:hypothetical protein